MKTSEAILYIVEQAGGKVTHTQFSEWIGQLIKSGHLSVVLQGPEKARQPFYQLTDKGELALKNRKTR